MTVVAVNPRDYAIPLSYLSDLAGEYYGRLLACQDDDTLDFGFEAVADELECQIGTATMRANAFRGLLTTCFRTPSP